MSEQHGEFGKLITLLDTAQEEVKSVWRDETARSFDPINDNIKLCTERIWTLFCDSKAGVEAVKKNYDSDTVDKDLARLGMQIEQV